MARCSREGVRKEPPLVSGFACEKTATREDPATAALRSPSPLDMNQMMSRYQRLIPTDCIPLTNGGGKKPPTIRAFKEGDADRIPNCSFPSSFDAKPLRARPVPFGSADRPAFPVPLSDHQPPLASSTSNGANILPVWGHKKRSRGSRADSRAAAAAEEPSSSPSRQVIKIQRRAAASAEKLAADMPPPSAAAYTRGANLRPCTPVRVATSALVNRSVEERSGSHTRSEKRSPTSPAEKGHKAVAELPNGKESKACPENDTPAGGGGGVPEKLNLRHFEWPRIYVSLSRKEKEDDFLVMKGTKLPQRPKKRAKNVERTLQYCYPGMWLSDLTRGRYEVREKKCVKKKRRGLKGMESMDSDSD